MMARSSQFMSLSGLSGIIAGIYAIIGARIAYCLIENHKGYYITLESTTFKLLLLTAGIVLLLSIGTAYWLTIKKAKKRRKKRWSNDTKKPTKLVIMGRHFSLPESFNQLEIFGEDLRLRPSVPRDLPGPHGCWISGRKSLFASTRWVDASGPPHRPRHSKTNPVTAASPRPSFRKGIAGVVA